MEKSYKFKKKLINFEKRKKLFYLEHDTSRRHDWDEGEAYLTGINKGKLHEINGSERDVFINNSVRFFFSLLYLMAKKKEKS